MTWLPNRPKYIRYKTPAGLVRAFVAGVAGPAGKTAKDWSAEGPHGESVDMVEGIRAMGFWGFAHPASDTIRYWVGPSIPLSKLVFFFGHEIGHLKEGLIRRTRNKEHVADTIGWIASEALRVAHVAKTTGGAS